MRPPRATVSLMMRSSTSLVVTVGVHPIAIRRLEEERFGLRCGLRIRQHRPVVAAQIAAKQHTSAGGVPPREANEGRSEEMAGVDELGFDAAHDLDPALERDGPKTCERLHRVGFREQRQRRGVLRTPGDGSPAARPLPAAVRRRAAPASTSRPSPACRRSDHESRWRPTAGGDRNGRCARASGPPLQSTRDARETRPSCAAGARPVPETVRSPPAAGGHPLRAGISIPSPSAPRRETSNWPSRLTVLHREIRRVGR